MTIDAGTVLRDALALPDNDRANLAAELLTSRPGTEGGLEIDSEEWVREMEHRARGVLFGETQTEDWDVVEKRILDGRSDG
jgi:hypothetical protein